MYDRQMLFDFFQQLLAELKIQQCGLESKSIPPVIRLGADKLRNKWGGSTLVPPLNEFDFALALFNGESDQRREKLAATRNEQFDLTRRLVKMLETLGIFKVSRRGQ